MLKATGEWYSKAWSEQGSRASLGSLSMEKGGGWVSGDGESVK